MRLHSFPGEHDGVVNRSRKRDEGGRYHDRRSIRPEVEYLDISEINLYGSSSRLIHRDKNVIVGRPAQSDPWAKQLTRRSWKRRSGPQKTRPNIYSSEDAEQEDSGETP